MIESILQDREVVNSILTVSTSGAAAVFDIHALADHVVVIHSISCGEVDVGTVAQTLIQIGEDTGLVSAGRFNSGDNLGGVSFPVNTRVLFTTTLISGKLVWLWVRYSLRRV